MGYNTSFHSFSHISESVIMNNLVICRGFKIHLVIINKPTIIHPGTIIGLYPEEDAQRFEITEEGIVVIQKVLRLA